MLTNEAVFPVTEIGKRLPGRPVHSTVYRWCVDGLEGVMLEHLALGRKLITSVEAVERFSRQVAAARAARRAARAVQVAASPVAPSSAAEHADAELAAA